MTFGGEGGGKGVLVCDFLQLYIVLSANYSYDYTFLWLNKSRHASSIHCVKFDIIVTALNLA